MAPVIRSMYVMLLLAFELIGCAQKAPIPRIVVSPDADNVYWILQEDLNYEVGTSGVIINVPAGFVTDFASIPRFLWSSGYTAHDRYSRAAVIHDYLYWDQSCSKAQADNLFIIAMKESLVGKVTLFWGSSIWSRRLGPE